MPTDGRWDVPGRLKGWTQKSEILKLPIFACSAPFWRHLTSYFVVILSIFSSCLTLPPLSRNFLFLLTYSSSLPSPVRTYTLLHDQWQPLDHFPIRIDRCSASNGPKGSGRFLRNADPLSSYTTSCLLPWELEISWRYNRTRMMQYDMVWYICQLQLGKHPVAVVQYTFTHKQYIKQHK